jgi:hypothetical protein
MPPFVGRSGGGQCALRVDADEAVEAWLPLADTRQRGLGNFNRRDPTGGDSVRCLDQ